MKLIRVNNIEIEKNPRLPLRTNARELIKNMVGIADEHVHYVKAEKEDNLLECHIHPFVEATHLAFSKHLPLVISPDMIWHLIACSISEHINNHSEELRKKFVDHEGKKTICINIGQSITSCPWHVVIDQFCMKIGQYTKNDVAEIMQADFSTTTEDSRVVSQIVLMDSMKNYFSYKCIPICGIPEIRVTGSKDDWINVRNKTKKMVEIIPALKNWMDGRLSVILENFIRIQDGDVDEKFWNSIYKYYDYVSKGCGGYGGPKITGWILDLFPYIHDDEPSSFKYRINQVPFELGNIKMLFVGGFVGVSAAAGDNALEPVFGYAIVENKKIKLSFSDFLSD